MKSQQLASQSDLGSILLPGPNISIDKMEYFHMNSRNFTSTDNNGATFQEPAGTYLHLFVPRTSIHISAIGRGSGRGTPVAHAIHSRHGPASAPARHGNIACRPHRLAPASGKMENFHVC